MVVFYINRIEKIRGRDLAHRFCISSCTVGEKIKELEKNYLIMKVSLDKSLMIRTIVKNAVDRINEKRLTKIASLNSLFI